MKLRLSCVLVGLAAAVHAAPSPPGHSRLIDGDPASVGVAAPPAVEFRANQINRCSDAGGQVKLQDTPCAPVPSPVVDTRSAASATDVVELSALPPRSVSPSGADRPAAANGGSFADLAMSLGWKLALFAAVCYAIFRLIRSWRDTYAFKAALDDAPRHSRR